MSQINLPGTLELKAAGDAQHPKFEIVAYTGGLIRVAGFGAVVIDISGLEFTEQISILADHDASLKGIVGRGVARAEGGAVVVAGELLAGEATDKIVELQKSGFQFQASVGVSPATTKRIRAGKKLSANGQTFTAPQGGITHVLTGRLREVSILALGADDTTSVQIAAQRDTEKMPGKIINDPIELERTRAANLATICAKHNNPSFAVDGENVTILAHAIEQGWDATKCELEAIRASRPKAPAAHIRQYGGGCNRESLECAILVHAGYSSLAEKMHGAETLEAAASLHCHSMADIARCSVQAAGGDVHGTPSDILTAALSGGDFSNALGNAQNRVLLNAYQSSPATWQAFANVRSVRDFKTQTAIRPSFVGGLSEIVDGGNFDHGSLTESTITFSIDTFAKQYKIGRQSLTNDDLGVFQDVLPSLGRRAMDSLSDKIYEVLMADAGSFFSSANSNLNTTAPLSSGSLADAITAMRIQRDTEGNDLNLQPTTLLVPPQLEHSALALLNSIELRQSTDGEPTGNPTQNAVKLEVEPRLSNTTKFTSGSSTTSWYLFAAPLDLPMIVGFLNGMQAPTTRYFGVDSRAGTLSASYDVHFDFGAALGDYRAAQKNTA